MMHITSHPIHPPPTQPQTDEPAAGYELVVVNTSSVRAISWASHRKLIVGRGSEVDVRLTSESVSRQHAMFSSTETTAGWSCTVEDLGSANGSFVNGRRVVAGRPVSIGPRDTVHVGDVLIVLRAIRDPAAPADHAQSFAPVVASPAMTRLYEHASLVARGTINVLLVGETGVGKDVMAQRLHECSPRRDGPFVHLNCAALSEALLESELFGHERGSFTGATTTKAGLLEAAAGGTVFLDEIGELPPAIQAKLLQVLEHRRVLRVGGLQPRPIDVRFVAATNRDLEADVAAGRFRGDLYFRLAGITLSIPPLRNRRDEILPLAEALARRTASAAGVDSTWAIDAEASQILVDYRWPGNIRELRNVVERALILCEHGTVRREHLPAALLADHASSVTELRPQPPAAIAVADEHGFSPEELAERQRLTDALHLARGNQSQAARALGISRGWLLVRLDALRIHRPRKRPHV